MEAVQQHGAAFASLQSLNLSHSFSAFSELPADFGLLLPNLTTLSCSYCNLMGSFPSGMTDLQLQITPQLCTLLSTVLLQSGRSQMRCLSYSTCS